jgi:hypothetical protein
MDAEEKVKEFINKKHVAVEIIYVTMMFPKRTSWVVKGEALFKRFHSLSHVTFEAQVNMNTGEVTAYEEKPFQLFEKNQRCRSS